MHNIVLKSFKILACSLLFMFLLDTILILSKTITVYNRLNKIGYQMQTEVARNNCIPTTLRTDVFEKQIADLQSSIGDVFVAWGTNMRGELNIDGTVYESIAESNVQDYGSIVDVCILAQLNPSYIIFSNGNNGVANMFKKTNAFNINLVFTYTAPCLRYLQ